MIICHPLKMIFIKTKKVGGTSFEIALSKFCDKDCVITPISPKDEQTRQALGFSGPQNFEATVWPDGTQGNGTFYNHIPAKTARQLIPEQIWESYQKVTIVRDPFAAFVSRYRWERQRIEVPDFGVFAHIYRKFLLENSDIAPIDGPDAPDVFLRYETLEDDIKALGVVGLWDVFCTINSTANLCTGTGATPLEMYQKFPDAADIVAEQCRPEIEKFRYSSPLLQLPTPVYHSSPTKSDFIFALAAGRSGTSWLAKFLGQNLNINSVHEPCNLDDFGTQMPEISAMRKFNEIGMDRSIRDFWDNKLAKLKPPYAESNHTLGKCGMIEALAESDIAERTTIVVLRRELAKQCVSYINRNDFSNIGLIWQFYLSPKYRNRIVDPAQFLPLGTLGTAIWYCLEMEARQAYYVLKYHDRLNFVEAQLEEVTKPAGARALLAELGHNAEPILPPKANANTPPSQPGLLAEMRR